MSLKIETLADRNIRLGYIIEIIQNDDNTINYSVSDTDQMLFTNVKALSMGSAPTKYSHAPYRIGDRVIFAYLQPLSFYYIIGGLIGGDEIKYGIETSKPDMNKNTQTISYRDLCFVNEDSKLVISENFSTLESKNIQIQLKGGPLRIADNGQCIDYATNAQHLIEALFPLLIAMQSKLDAVTSCVEKSAPGIVAAYEAAAIAADTAVPGSGQIFREQSNEFQNDLASALSTIVPSASVVKKTCETYAVNKKVLLPK